MNAHRVALLLIFGMPLFAFVVLTTVFSHPVIRGLGVTVVDEETVLLSQYDPGRELEDLLMAKLVQTADRPRIERHDVSRGIIKSLITVGLGVSLVAESDIGVNFAGLTYREVRDGAGPSQVNYSAHWREDNDNPALANFLKLLSERYPLPCAG